MNKIAISTVIRNEDDFLDEFFQYYIGLGFVNFIILDDESTDNSECIINFYEKLVNIIIIPVNVLNMYNTVKKGINYFIENKIKFHCLREEYILEYVNFKIFDYILIIDIDEFLYIPEKINLIDFLMENKKNKKNIVIIPRIDIGTKNFSKNILNLETLKYNFKKEDIDCFKHFCNPNKTFYFNGHISYCSNFNYPYNEKYLTKFIKKQNYIFDKKRILLFHLITKTKEIAKKNMIKYRKNVGNSYRNNLKILKNIIPKLTLKNDLLINNSKKIFRKFFEKYGFLIIKNFIEKKRVSYLYNYFRKNEVKYPNCELNYSQMNGLFPNKINSILIMLGISDINKISYWFPLNNNKINRLKIIPKSSSEKNYIDIELDIQGIIFLDKSIEFKNVINDKENLRWIQYDCIN